MQEVTIDRLSCGVAALILIRVRKDNAMLKTEFWKRAAGSLPASVRARHIEAIARAERFEILLDGLIDAASQLKLAVARAFARPTHQH